MSSIPGWPPFVLEKDLELLVPFDHLQCWDERLVSNGEFGYLQVQFLPITSPWSSSPLLHICLSTLLSTQVPLPGSPVQERSTQTPVKTPCPRHFHDASYTHLIPILSVFPQNQPSILILFLSNTVCFRNETILPARVREGIYYILTSPRFIKA